MLGADGGQFQCKVTVGSSLWGYRGLTRWPGKEWVPYECNAPARAKSLTKLQRFHVVPGLFEYPTLGEAFQGLHLTGHQRIQAGGARSAEIQLVQTGCSEDGSF